MSEEIQLTVESLPIIQQLRAEIEARERIIKQLLEENAKLKKQVGDKK